MPSMFARDASLMVLNVQQLIPIPDLKQFHNLLSRFARGQRPAFHFLDVNFDCSDVNICRLVSDTDMSYLYQSFRCVGLFTCLPCVSLSMQPSIRRKADVVVLMAKCA